MLRGRVNIYPKLHEHSPEPVKGRPRGAQVSSSRGLVLILIRLDSDLLCHAFWPLVTVKVKYKAMNHLCRQYDLSLFLALLHPPTRAGDSGSLKGSDAKG
jgi:hypothetical protein